MPTATGGAHKCRARPCKAHRGTLPQNLPHSALTTAYPRLNPGAISHGRFKSIVSTALNFRMPCLLN
eukprot:336594-Chlamydomonas_euryale.AAC.2